MIASVIGVATDIVFFIEALIGLVVILIWCLHHLGVLDVDLSINRHRR